MIKGKTICSLHFKLEDYDFNIFGMMRPTLKPTAVLSALWAPDDQQAGGVSPPAAKRTAYR